eukprot:NODE_11592_length_301_cov_24.392857_g10679_i0.p1 GENE.NODE_11592_length_301_cov_24.392857_g10679_i0~~NODE_11592_length_301_cov_24.392857_g10679_i0.p1  ORF type:complete len:74 (+),score=40.58 NODE_11592_length_301_cov_24.392857_g10679_i0:23-223(+)
MGELAGMKAVDKILDQRSADIHGWARRVHDEMDTNDDKKVFKEEFVQNFNKAVLKDITSALKAIVA